MKKIKAILAFITVGAMTVFAGCASTDTGVEREQQTPFMQFMSSWGIFILLGGLLLAWFFLSGSRRKKQVQESQNMLNSIRPGVYVMTQGGVIGKVIEIKVISPTEKHVILETGTDEHKSYITYDIRAIGFVLKPEQLVPRPAAEEVFMPSDDEIQKRLDEVYSAPAEVSEAAPAETVEPETAETVPPVASEEIVETETITPEGKVKVKKPAAKKTDK